jgi:cation:H+ antiporter
LTAGLVFLASGAAVAGAGIRLAEDGDTIAEGTGLGGMWVGAILVAGATSLPELTTDIHAVLQEHPSLAIGDLLGSNMANMMVLAVADLLSRQGRVLARVLVNQVLVATLAILLTTIALVGILSRAGTIAGLGWPALAIGFAYFAGMRLLHRNRAEPPFSTSEEIAADRRASRSRVPRAAVGFLLASIVILVAAPFLASSTATLADQLGVSQGFAGMLLLAVTTSLPEMMVSYASVRAGSYDLAVGNLFGSNCFNMAVILPLDIVFGRGSILAAVPSEVAVGGLFAVLLMSLAVLDVLHKAERRWWIVEPGPMFMLLVYLVGLYLTYSMGRVAG